MAEQEKVKYKEVPATLYIIVGWWWLSALMSFLGIITIPFALLFIWIAENLRKGKNWAYLTSLILNIISAILPLLLLVLAFLSKDEGTKIAFIISSVISLILSLIIILLHFDPKLRKYFEEKMEEE
jgi:sugar phosphate permease